MKRQYVMSAIMAGIVGVGLAGCTKSVERGTELVSMPLAAKPGSAEPHLARGRKGEIVLSWLEPDGNAVALRYTVLHENEWRAPRTVASGDNWFVNWADFPSVVPIDETLWAAHWLAKRPGGIYSYDVMLALSDDAGATWSPPVTPHTDGTRTEHGFVSLFPLHNGVGAVWLDGRNMAEDTPGHDAAGTGHMTLRSAVMTADGSIRAGAEVDDLVCDCCQTDVALGAAGPLLVYRNRTAAEIRDIHLARLIDGQWVSGAVADDGWVIAGCPVNGPAIAAEKDEAVVAWFTAADDRPRVRFARSQDGGWSFDAAVDIATAGVVGRVDVELLEDGTAVVSWLRSNEAGQGELCARTVSADGETGPVRIIAETSTARASGFPQMVRAGDALVFAWTDASGESKKIRSGRLATAALN